MTESGIRRAERQQTGAQEGRRSALGGLPITQVYFWVTEQVSQEPIEILREHDYELQYRGLESTLKLADKQRYGIFGTAEKMIQCLKSRNTLRWVAPTGGAAVATDARRQFNPPAFAASQETIYILSKEGTGSAAPLTTALTVAIAEAMEERAERSDGRLPRPALFYPANGFRVQVPLDAPFSGAAVDVADIGRQHAKAPRPGTPRTKEGPGGMVSRRKDLSGLGCVSLLA